MRTAVLTIFQPDQCTYSLHLQKVVNRRHLPWSAPYPLDAVSIKLDSAYMTCNHLAVDELHNLNLPLHAQVVVHTK